MVRTGKRRIKESRNALDGITLARLAVEMRPIASLKPYARNPRTHTNRQIGQIAASIRAFGFNNPVLIDRNDEMLAMGESRRPSFSTSRACPPFASST
jgi:ParB-like nuclease domain